jgi:hypothetical protein
MFVGPQGCEGWEVPERKVFRQTASPLRDGSFGIDGDHQEAVEVDDGIRVNWKGGPVFSWRPPDKSSKGKNREQPGNGLGSGHSCFAVVGVVCCHLTESSCR